jgi:hypothetical protein
VIPEFLEELVMKWGKNGSGLRYNFDLRDTLETHPVVPLDELRTHLDLDGVDKHLVALIDKYTPKFPPNPEERGTYAWAWVEHDRHRDVRRRSWDISRVILSEAEWEELLFNASDFRASDWEVVP